MAQEPRDNNDGYTGTENQHDFGKHAGIKWEVLMNDSSRAYRDYVDSKFTWNQQHTDRGETTRTIANVGINDGQYKMTSGTNNQEFPGGNNSANSPFNQNNEPLWAYNDDGILIRTTGLSKQQLQEGLDFVDDNTPLPIGEGQTEENHWNKSTRNITVQSYNERKRYRYKIIRVEQGDKNSIYKGRILAEQALEIPNNSIVVVDTDQTIGSHFKQNQGYHKANGRPIPNRNTNDMDVEFVLWWFINPITAADSARKATVGNKKLFNDFTGITVKGLVSYSDVEISGDNNNNKLNFKVKTYSMPDNINQSGQIWTPLGDRWTADDFVTPTMNVDYCKKNNNAPNCSKVAKGLVASLRNGDKYMKPPPQTVNAKREYNNQIWHLCRKRTGDLWQGEITRRLTSLFATTPLREYCFKKNQAGELINPDLDETQRTLLSFCRTWRINAENAPWNQNGEPNIIHSTGDYPHLSWCLEHGLNVLFKPPKTTNYFYFKRIIE